MSNDRPPRADAAGAATPPAIRVDGLTKRFGSVVACDDVDLTLERHGIHGILGENGAGKTTLMRMLIGLVIPDAGTIAVAGQPCEITDPIDAAAHGIGMVHQHLSLVNTLTVWENVALGDDHRLDPEGTRDQIRELGKRYGLPVDPNAIVGDLPIGVRQRVEIIKCLRRSPDVVILDEPTSMLTPSESHQLFDALRELVTEDGRTVALVSHRLDEVLDATDDVTIMRRGRIVERMETTAADPTTLARAMVGRSVVWRGAPREATDTTSRSERPVLQIRGAVVTNDDGHRPLDGLDLDAGKAEIVGIAGIEGNGQQALVDVLSSLTALESGTVLVDDARIATGIAGAMADAGIGVIPADRHDSGVVLEMSVAENLAIVDVAHRARWGILPLSSMHARAAELIDQYEIECSGPDAPLWSLSGGSQQRVVLARELSRDPRVLVAAQPTRGLDVGAIEYLNEQLRITADRGIAVVLISNEIDEILDLSTRVAVMFGGAIIGEMPGSETDREQLGLLMGGRTS